MKKFVTLGLAAVFATALVTACQKKEETKTETPATTEQPAVVQETGTTATTTTSTESTATTATATTPAAGTATTTETKKKP